MLPRVPWAGAATFREGSSSARTRSSSTSLLPIRSFSRDSRCPSRMPSRRQRRTNVVAKPLPATGAYVVSEYVPNRRLELVRNPHFHEWSAAARPDGYPDAILEMIGMTRDDATTAVEHDRLDYAPGLALPRLDEVVTRYAGQLAEFPTFPDKFLAAEHAHSAIRHTRRAQCTQLCPGSRGDYSPQRRCRARSADVPDPPTELPWLLAVLSLHGRPNKCRYMECAGSRSGSEADRPIEDARGARDRNHRTGRAGSHESANTSSGCSIVLATRHHSRQSCTRPWHKRRPSLVHAGTRRSSLPPGPPTTRPRVLSSSRLSAMQFKRERLRVLRSQPGS